MIKRYALRALAIFLVLASLGSREARSSSEADLLARYYFDCLSVVYKQAMLVSQAAEKLQEWRKGRDSTENTLAKLKSFRERHKGLARVLAKIKVPAKGDEMSSQARVLTQAYNKLLQSALTYVIRGEVDNKASAVFVKNALKVTLPAEQGLLSARLGVTKRILSSADRSELNIYFSWQEQILPMQMEVLKLSSRLHNLLLDNEQNDETRKESLVLLRRSIAIRTRAQELGKRLPVDLEWVHQEYLNELTALTRFCEAVYLYQDDPGPESELRVRRAMRMLRERSLHAQYAVLETLAPIMGQRFP